MIKTRVADFEIDSEDAAKIFTSAAIATIEDLKALLRDETAYLKRAQYGEASALAERKVGLVNNYARYMTTARVQGASLRRYAPDAIDRLMAMHDSLADAARENLPVVERARDVALRVVNGANSIASAKRAGPTTYGSHGREKKNDTVMASPIAVNQAV